MLVVDPGGHGYAFRHALTRDAVYEDMLPGERGGLLLVDAKRVRDQPTQVFGREWAELDVLHPSGGADRLQLSHERMRCRDLVVPVGAN